MYRGQPNYEISNRTQPLCQLITRLATEKTGRRTGKARASLAYCVKKNMMKYLCTGGEGDFNSLILLPTWSMRIGFKGLMRERERERETNGQAHTISRLPLLDEKVGLHELIEFPHCACVNISSFCLGGLSWSRAWTSRQCQSIDAPEYTTWGRINAHKHWFVSLEGVPHPSAVILCKGSCRN